MARTPPRPRRHGLALLVLVLAALGGAAPAFAQDPFADFFGGLFGGGRRSSASPSGYEGAPRVRRIMPHRENRAPTYWHGQSRPKRNARRGEDDATPAAPAQASAAPASFFIAALGDTLALQLGDGLKESFADKTDVAILRKAKENSGLVRDDFYDWPKAARELAAGAQKIDVALMMLGSNDRQPIHQGGETLEPLSPRWREIYTARVDAMIAAFKEKNIPLVWVGLPVMKAEHYSADIAKLNEIYRERAAHAGIAYVDLWEPMADEKGQYSAFGPNINGEIVKLRASDGVHFTDVGARSAAHFVDSAVKKIYDTRKTPPPAAGAAPSPAAGAAPAAKAEPAPPGAPVVFRSPVADPNAPAPTLPERPAIGAAQPLDNAVAGASELARRAPARAAAAPAEALARHVFVEGGDQAPRANRADDFRWRAKAPELPRP